MYMLVVEPLFAQREKYNIDSYDSGLLMVI